MKIFFGKVSGDVVDADPSGWFEHNGTKYAYAIDFSMRGIVNIIDTCGRYVPMEYSDAEDLLQASLIAENYAKTMVKAEKMAEIILNPDEVRSV
jgi:hypothetical protein